MNQELLNAALNDPAIKACLEELQLWESDKIPKTFSSLTRDQMRAYFSSAPIIIINGGNQSGKTFTTCFIVTCLALGIHPRSRPGPLSIWYSTVTYEKFGTQAWDHFKKFLLLPGESVMKCPTRRIQNVAWHDKSPEKPEFFAIKRKDGSLAEVTVKSYESGAGDFASKSVDVLVIDEECSEPIYRESRARFFAVRDPILIIPATPVIGVGWLRRLKSQSVNPTSGVQQFNLKTYDNPVANQEEIARIREQYKSRPEELALRLEGVDKSATGLVYNDDLFTQDHVIDNSKNIVLDPGVWSLARGIDAGYRNPAAVWMAVNKDGHYIIYRSWKGQNLIVRDAMAKIRQLSAPDIEYTVDVLDREVAATDPLSGETELDVWRRNGFEGTLSVAGEILPQIRGVQDLMAQRIEVCGKMVPAIQVFSTCTEWLDERENYKYPDQEEDESKDDRERNPVKRFDHCMDAMKNIIAAGFHWQPRKYKVPEKGTMGFTFWKDRHPDPKCTL